MAEIDRKLLELRQYGFRAHNGWKLRGRLSDQIIQGDWWTAWPDITGEYKQPLVENVYVEALYDKAASVASNSPTVEVAPRRGTRQDRAEKSAERRRRVFRSHLLTFIDLQVQWAMDWLQHGAMFGMPWKDWRTQDQHPFGMRLDPRWAYPLAHNARGELTQAFFLRYRPLNEVANDYAMSEDAIKQLMAFLKGKGVEAKKLDSHSVEEYWYVDQEKWGLAIVASERPTPDMWRYNDPMQQPTGDMFTNWVIPLHEHRMGRCPVVEKRRLTSDGEYRGALDDMIPNLQVAQNLMARLLEAVDIQTGIPIGLDNVANPEDFRPGGILRGTGEDQLRIVVPDFPVNFEAITHARTEIDAARNVAGYPQQRSGEHGASIASGKAAGAVMGAFNAMEAWTQRDLAVFYREMLSAVARFDEQWCPGSKEVTGWDQGEMYSETYDASTFYSEDYRNEITFTRVGIEEHNFLTRLGLMKNLGAMSTRTLMKKANLVDNHLQEERDMDEEQSKAAFFALIQQQALQGNADPLWRYWQKIDSDGKTTREAVGESIVEMRLVSSDGRLPRQPNEPDATLQERSLDAGGVPGQARGLPAPQLGGALAGMLPASTRRQVEEAR